jgi:membrane protein required for colicin V production
MNSVDYIIIIFAAIGFILGYKDGFLRKIIGIAGLILGIYCAFKFYVKISPFFINFFEGDRYLSDIAAGLIIYVIIVLISSILKRIVHPFDKVNFLVNKLIGGAVGVVQMLIYLSLIFLILYNFNFPERSKAKKSKYYSKVIKIVPSVLNKVTDSTNTIRETINDIIKNSEN